MARIKKPYRTEAVVRVLLDPNDESGICPQCREKKNKFLFGTVLYQAGSRGEDVVKWYGNFCSVLCKDEWVQREVTSQRQPGRKSALEIVSDNESMSAEEKLEAMKRLLGTAS